MNVDEIFRHIGEFGPYQKLVYVLLNLIGVTHGFRMLIAVFMLYTPKHRCALPGYPNDTYRIQSEEHAHIISSLIPNNTEDEDLGPYDRCHMYTSDGPHNISGGDDVVGCHSWVYDKSMFVNTAVMEFDAVCDDSMLGSHSQMAQMSGFLFGVLFFGAIGDKFGRKTAMYLGVITYVLGGFGLAWSPLVGYGFFVFLRFVNGASSAGAYTSACVLSVEMVGPNKRLWVGVLLHLTFGIGGMMLDLIGYFERDWFFINLIGTAPIVLALSFWWIIPESPRWLAKKGRMKEAEAILRKTAKFNGKEFPDHLISNANQTTSDSKNSDVIKTANERDRTSNGTEGGLTNGNANTTASQNPIKEFFRMFTFRVLLIRNLVVFLNWFAVSMAYYGLSLTADQLAAGTLFTNFLLSMCMDLLANGIVLLLMDRWGRRPLHATNMIVGGVGCLIGVLTTMVAPSGLQWMTIVVAMIGKLGSSAGFTLVYIYSSELYPTMVRSAGMGISSAFARLGSILASYVQQWSVEMGGDLGHALPLLMFGAFSLAAGLFTLLLPETLHKDLPDTIEDGLVFGKNPQKDEHQDPVKTMEVFTMDNIQIEMESLKTPDQLAKDQGVIMKQK